MAGDDMSDFAINLKIFRKNKKYSQEQLAQKLNYGYTAIANYESGRNEPSIDDLMKLARVLNVTLDELVGLELTTQENEFLSSFKKLNEENQNRILDLMDALQN